MKLSISNIAWEAKDDFRIYEMMKRYDFKGVEIAPTRIFAKNPYSQNEAAKIWSESLREEHDFVIPSMQSIWYGREEKIFGTQEERKILVDYTKKAIDFASVIKCKNLVFGCPRNRNISGNSDKNIAIGFFEELGDYAAEKGVVIGMEANPTIYNTNYINDTISAIELVELVKSDGFKVNLDVGTMVQNQEIAEMLSGNVHLINHVHISEPFLKPVEERNLHRELREVLYREGYKGFVSIEMGKMDDINVIEETMSYVRRVFA